MGVVSPLTVLFAAFHRSFNRHQKLTDGGHGEIERVGLPKRQSEHEDCFDGDSSGGGLFFPLRLLMLCACASIAKGGELRSRDREIKSGEGVVGLMATPAFRK
jgi:hypothetical protein